MRYLALALLLVLPGCGGRADVAPNTRTASGISATFTPDPNPPRVGHDSGFVVTLAEEGQPVTGGAVHIQLLFSTLNQQGPSGVCAETAPGRYEVKDLSTGMNGRWDAAVTVSRANKPDAKFSFPFTVQK